jgi:hypothetical protein
VPLRSRSSLPRIIRNFWDSEMRVLNVVVSVSIIQFMGMTWKTIVSQTFFLSSEAPAMYSII